MSQIADVVQIKELGNRLRKLREGKGLSQDALAQKAKLMKAPIDKQTIWRIETGRQKAVRQHTLDALARALGVPPGTLIGAAPLPEVQPARAGRPNDEDYSINVQVDGAIRNAFTLAAMRYRVPIAQIVKLAPFLFVLAAEGSIERRRSALKDLREAFDNAQNLAMDFRHLPSSLLPSGSSAPELADEEKSISIRDILGETLPDNESIGSVIDPDYDESQYNPLVVYLKQAVRLNPDVALIRRFDRYSAEFDVCREDAMKLAGDDKELAQSIIDGEIILHKMQRELPNDAATEARIAWLREKREQNRAAVAAMIAVTIDDLLF